MKLLKWICGNL
jgi:hypothetical protein